jgi:hypothetical protein
MLSFKLLERDSQVKMCYVPFRYSPSLQYPQSIESSISTRLLEERCQQIDKCCLNKLYYICATQKLRFLRLLSGHPQELARYSSRLHSTLPFHFETPPI